MSFFFFWSDLNFNAYITKEKIDLLLPHSEFPIFFSLFIASKFEFPSLLQFHLITLEYLMWILMQTGDIKTVEERLENGVVRGSYSLVEPDGKE